MSGGLLDYTVNNLDTIMTGLTMAVIGIGVYEARDGFFLFNGSFRGKYVALAIFLGTLVVASLFTPFIDDFWMRNLPQIAPRQLLGLILILGMIAVNKTAEWNYLDPKSLVVYLLGVILIYLS